MGILNDILSTLDQNLIRYSTDNSHTKYQHPSLSFLEIHNIMNEYLENEQISTSLSLW